MSSSPSLVTRDLKRRSFKYLRYLEIDEGTDVELVNASPCTKLRGGGQRMNWRAAPNAQRYVEKDPEKSSI